MVVGLQCWQVSAGQSELGFFPLPPFLSSFSAQSLKVDRSRMNSATYRVFSKSAFEKEKRKGRAKRENGARERMNKVVVVEKRAPSPADHGAVSLQR